MELRRIFIEPAELAALTPDLDDTEDGRTFVAFAGGAAYTVVSDDDALAIAEAWRRLEQQILERRHGALAVL